MVRTPYVGIHIPSATGRRVGARDIVDAFVAEVTSGRLPAGCRVRTLGDAPKAADIVAAVRAEGHRRILCEGGPTLLGRMVWRSLRQAYPEIVAALIAYAEKQA